MIYGLVHHCSMNEDLLNFIRQLNTESINIASKELTKMEDSAVVKMIQALRRLCYWKSIVAV